MGFEVSSQGVKWLEHEVDHSAPSTVKVKDKHIYISPPLICLHGVDNDNSLDSKGLVTFPSTYTTSQFRNNTACLCFGSAQSNLLHPCSYSLLRQCYNMSSLEILSLNNLRTKQYKQTDTTWHSFLTKILHQYTPTKDWPTHSSQPKYCVQHCCYPPTYLKSENILNAFPGTISISW